MMRVGGGEENEQPQAKAVSAMRGKISRTYETVQVGREEQRGRCRVR
jgi:hypothetical protein